MKRDGKGGSRGNNSSGVDFATLIGLVIAFGGILGGLVLEGGKVADVTQITAAMIVIGGTVGAVMVTTPLPILLAAVKKSTRVLWDSTARAEPIIEQLLRYAKEARKGGLISLESELDRIADPFLRKGLTLAVDGADLEDVRRILEAEIAMAEERGEAEAKVFEAAGGYSPTIGIIGAVLGLIQVMKHLEDIEKVGHGIAVAFVATVYGVALANLVLLPIGSKLKSRLQQSLRLKELTLEGLMCIAEGMNPNVMRSKLEAYANDAGGKRKPGVAKVASIPNSRVA